MSYLSEFENEEKWRKTGLLEGHEGFDALVLVNNLEECANYLLDLPEGENRELESGILLPSIVRLFNEQNVRSLDMDDLHEKYLAFLRKNQNLLRIDEQKFCERFVERFDEIFL